ncbi:MAG: tetratricopeptide repeat protein [Bradyrhizobium sp.]
MSASASPVSSIEDARLRASQQLALGQRHFAEGSIAQAIAAYRCGLDAAIAGREVSADTVAELHAKLGNAYMVGGNLESASEHYKSALRLKPGLTACWCNLGNAQLQSGKADAAIALYLKALKHNPAHWPSRTNLVQALMAARQYLMAKMLLTELAGERPQDGQLFHQLGKACFEMGEAGEALDHLQEAVRLDPRDADSLYWIGAIRQKIGDADAARAAYAQAAKIQPLIRRRAVKSPADFRVLALYAPFAGNTPVEYLFKDAAYDTDTLALFAGREADASALGGVGLVVNLISDADQAEAVLPLAAHLVEKLGRPVVNDPCKIQRTTRDAVARLLPGISGCRIPRIVRLEAGADVSVAALAARIPFSFPVLARRAGTHGGDDFEKVESVGELSRLLAGRPDGDGYVIEYVDYASTDGHFRKYRFIFVGEEIMPYHLAIGDNWKVHHASTDMASQRWMQDEEAAFLAEPGAVFTASHYQALRTIRERIGLDYFGIDCGLDASRNLVVFEVNASMLVHEDNAEFPYKDPFVRAIKHAFDAMLQQRASPPAAA